jgi:ferritin
MISNKMEKALNQQIKLEAESSQVYLGMASWAETEGLNGIADFLFGQADEERQHMLKLMRYVNERGGHAVVPALNGPENSYKNVRELFESFLAHEEDVSKKIHGLVDLSMNEHDYSTHNFLQWYVAEQIEEEALARTILDKLRLIGDDKGGFYMFDRDLVNIKSSLGFGKNVSNQ